MAIQVTFISKTLFQMPFFSVLRLRHTCADSHPDRGSKKETLTVKKWSCFAKKLAFVA